MNGTQQTQDTVAQEPLQPAAANSNAAANANGSSTAAKKRKKESLKPIITTETPPPIWHTAQRKQRAVSSQCAQHRAAQFVSHPGIWTYAEQRTAFERCCDSTVKDVEEEHDETTDNE
ncbi:hypothetical protein CSPX01_06437 [Colletotrichum filicis]|nr:hypothetical protein CSPX01_06437 [Colletotrichum filicis]